MDRSIEATDELVGKVTRGFCHKDEVSYDLYRDDGGNIVVSAVTFKYRGREFSFGYSKTDSSLAYIALGSGDDIRMIEIPAAEIIGVIEIAAGNPDYFDSMFEIGKKQLTEGMFLADE